MLTNEATAGVYPENREDAPDEWKRAYDHAATCGCAPKAAALYADTHASDFGNRSDTGGTE